VDCSARLIDLSAKSKRKNAAQKSFSQSLSPVCLSTSCSPIDVQLTPSQAESCVPCSNSSYRPEDFLCAINSERLDRNGTNVRTSLLFDRVRPPAPECRGTTAPLPINVISDRRFQCCRFGTLPKRKAAAISRLVENSVNSGKAAQQQRLVVG
jgi:hypothetical protein